MSKIITESISDLNHPALLINKKNIVTSHSLYFSDIKDKSLKYAFSKLKLAKSDEENICLVMKSIKEEPADFSLSSNFRCRMLPIDKEIFLEVRQN